MSMEQPQRGTYQDDEISLIDLAKILIRRRWWLIGTSGVIVLLALVFALINRNGGIAYHYNSIYQLAETSPGNALGSTSSLIQRVQTFHWPDFRRSYMEENGLETVAELPFDLSVENPASTTLITLRSVALDADEEEVKVLHRHLLDEINKHQKEIFERERRKLNQQIDRTENMLNRAQEDLAQAEFDSPAMILTQEITDYTERLFTLQDRLEDLTPGEVVQMVGRGDRGDTGSLSGVLILVLGILLGGFAGIMAAFTAEFVVKVRESLKKDKESI